MKFTYRLQKQANAWLAECVECEAMGEGGTQSEALDSLRASLEERMFRPDAVAPPPEEAHAPIELELATEKRPVDTLDLGGPGG
jgi:hypothetical protein